MPNSHPNDTPTNSMIITKSLMCTTNTSELKQDKRSKPNVNDQSTGHCCTNMHKSSKALIDTLRLTISVTPYSTLDSIKQSIKELLEPFHIKPIQQKASSTYFEHGVLLRSSDGSKQNCGSIKWASDRVQLELSGAGCNYVHAAKGGMSILHQFVQARNASLKRVDVAVDDFSGKFNLRDTSKAYSRGSYTQRGAKPKKVIHSSNSGRTVYIGSNKSVRQMCIYEKDKEQNLPKHHDYYNTWTRHELRLKASTSFNIPLDILVSPDGYFAGAYPANRRILKDVEPRSVKREVTLKLANTAYKASAQLRYQYGKHLFQLCETGISIDHIAALLSRPGTPNNIRLPYFVNHNDLWKEVISQLEQAQTHRAAL